MDSDEEYMSGLSTDDELMADESGEEGMTGLHSPCPAGTPPYVVMPLGFAARNKGYPSLNKH